MSEKDMTLQNYIEEHKATLENCFGSVFDISCPTGIGMLMMSNPVHIKCFDTGDNIGIVAGMKVTFQRVNDNVSVITYTLDDDCFISFNIENKMFIYNRQIKLFTDRKRGTCLIPNVAIMTQGFNSFHQYKGIIDSNASVTCSSGESSVHYKDIQDLLKTVIAKEYQKEKARQEAFKEEPKTEENQ